MKNIISRFLTLLVCVAGFAVQSTAQNYVELNQAISRAEKNGKLILLECYADWNAGSRWMKKVLANAEVAKYLDENFIVSSIDTDTTLYTGFVQAYEVMDFPTLLILTGNGTEITRIVGTFEPIDFLAELKNIILSRKGGYSTERSNAQWTLRQIGTQLNKGDFDGARVLSEKYFGMLPPEDIVIPANWYIFENPELARYGSPAFKYLLINRELFIKNIGLSKVDKALKTACTEHILPYAMGAYHYDSTVIAEFIKSLPEIDLTSDKDLFLLTQMAASRNDLNCDLYIKQLREAIDIMPEEMRFTLTASLAFVKDKSNKATRRAAIRLIERTIGQIGVPSQIALLTELRNSMQ